MKLKIKKYNYLKVRKYLKNSRLFLVYNYANTTNFLKIDQKFKALNFKYFKISNVLAVKAFKDSIYENFKVIINGPIVLVKQKSIFSNLTFKLLVNLHEFYKLISIKVGDKIYPTSKIHSSFQLNYKNDNLLLLKSLKKSLILTNKLK